MAEGSAHPTQTDVARRAGVSRALVSIVFRDEPGASQATRDHVRAVAAEIGYVPDQRAQLLRRKPGSVVGVSFGLGQDFHSTLVEHLYAAADQAGLTLILSGFGAGRPETAAMANLLAYRCSGLVLVGSTLRGHALAEVATSVPTVVTFRPARRPAGVVRTDDADGARRAAEHLLALGHHRLVHVDGGRAAGAAERRRSVRRTVDRAGADYAVLAGGLTEADGMAAGERLAEMLAGTNPPTGVVAFNDRSAVGVLAALRRAGHRVPEDVSVVGFDDSAVAAVPGIDLTTIRQDTRAMAEHALRQLASRMADPGRAAEEVVMPAELVVRRTTARPRADEPA